MDGEWLDETVLDVFSDAQGRARARRRPRWGNDLDRTSTEGIVLAKRALACLEGATDEQTALSAIDGIVRRYEDIVTTEGWEPSFGR
jgi:hypothetical protein